MGTNEAWNQHSGNQGQGSPSAAQPGDNHRPSLLQPILSLPLSSAEAPQPIRKFLLVLDLDSCLISNLAATCVKKQIHFHFAPATEQVCELSLSQVHSARQLCLLLFRYRLCCNPEGASTQTGKVASQPPPSFHARQTTRSGKVNFWSFVGLFKLLRQ